MVSIGLKTAVHFVLMTNSIQIDSSTISVQSTIRMIQQTMHSTKIHVLHKIRKICKSNSNNKNNSTYKNVTMDSLGNVQSKRKMKKKMISGIHLICWHQMFAMIKMVNTRQLLDISPCRRIIWFRNIQIIMIITISITYSRRMRMMICISSKRKKQKSWIVLKILSFWIELTAIRNTQRTIIPQSARIV